MAEEPKADTIGDKLKTYFVQVVIKKMANQGIQMFISSALVFLAAHQDWFEALGITTFDWSKGWPYPNQPPSGMVTLIEWKTLGIGGAAALFSGFAIGYVWFQHHAIATITGKPQDGDKRTGPPQPIEGGARTGDSK